MKANEVLKLLQITRPTLTKYVKNGWIKGELLKNGQYWYDEKSVYEFLNKKTERNIVIYARVSTQKQKKDLENQIELLKKYCFENGYKIKKIYKDISSGISYEKRKDFFDMFKEIEEYKVEKVIITYKDRLSRIGFELFDMLFLKYGTKIEVVSEIGNKKIDAEEIFEEIITLIHAFSMKLYSSRKSKKIQIEEKEQCN